MVMKKHLISGLCLILVAMSTSPVSASTRLKNICRVKGQEENTLRGMGLVVGLNGTGESNDPSTMRAIAQAMQVMGNPVAMDGQNPGFAELRKYKNVAMVMVSATVPATGARRGDHVDCYVSAFNGKSLAGGRLAFASLKGPNTQDQRVYALCEGQLTIDNPDQPMVGVVHNGCQIEAELLTPFHRDGYMTLILDKNHADFQTSNEIVQRLREQLAYSESGDAKQTETMVRAIDAANIVVKIPTVFMQDPVAFASDLLELRIEDPQTESRVVINARAGTIVISGDIEIGDVIVSHKNIVIETLPPPSFTAIDLDESSKPIEGTTKPKLTTLVDQLNSLKVPTADMIDIICGIACDGKLHGKLVME